MKLGGKPWMRENRLFPGDSTLITRSGKSLQRTYQRYRRVTVFMFRMWLAATHVGGSVPGLRLNARSMTSIMSK